MMRLRYLGKAIEDLRSMRASVADDTDVAKFLAGRIRATLALLRNDADNPKIFAGATRIRQHLINGTAYVVFYDVDNVGGTIYILRILPGTRSAADSALPVNAAAATRDAERPGLRSHAERGNDAALV